jgi:hypothetical protein
MKLWLLTLTVSTIIFHSTPAAGERGEERTEEIRILLNCAWSIANSTGNLGYEEYVVAAAQLAADKGMSLESLSREINTALETSVDFSQEKESAEKCVKTLGKVEG